VQTRSIVGWATGWTAHKKDLENQTVELEARIKELETENNLQLNSIGDLQKELQSVRGEAEAANTFLKQLEAQEKVSQVQKAEALASATEQFTKTYSQLKDLTGLLSQIRELAEVNLSTKAEGKEDTSSVRESNNSNQTSSSSAVRQSKRSGLNTAAPQESRPTEQQQGSESQSRAEEAPTAPEAATTPEVVVADGGSDGAGKAETGITLGNMNFSNWNAVNKFCNNMLKSYPLGESLPEAKAAVLLELLEKSFDEDNFKTPGMRDTSMIVGSKVLAERNKLILEKEQEVMKLVHDIYKEKDSYQGLQIQVLEVEEEMIPGSRRSFHLVEVSSDGQPRQHRIFNFRRNVILCKRKFQVAGSGGKSAVLQGILTRSLGKVDSREDSEEVSKKPNRRKRRQHLQSSSTA